MKTTRQALRYAFSGSFVRPGFLQDWLVLSQGFHVRNSVFLGEAASVHSNRTSNTRQHLRRGRDTYLLFSPPKWASLQGERQRTKGLCPMVLSQRQLKLDILFLKTWVFIISTSSLQAMLVRNTLCFHLITWNLHISYTWGGSAQLLPDGAADERCSDMLRTGAVPRVPTVAPCPMLLGSVWRSTCDYLTNTDVARWAVVRAFGMLCFLTSPPQHSL